MGGMGPPTNHMGGHRPMAQPIGQHMRLLHHSAGAQFVPQHLSNQQLHQEKMMRQSQMSQMGGQMKPQMATVG